MASPLFQITAADLQGKITPRNGGYSFLIDDEGDLTTAEVESILAIAEDKVLSRLPPRYRRMLRHIDAEFVVRYATDGQTSAQLALYPLVGDGSSLKLYRNYALHGRGFGARNVDDELPSDQWSVNATTGEITFSTPLNKSDTILAEYDHSAAYKCLALRDAALTLAAVEVARRLAFFSSAEGFDRFSDWETSTYQDLNRVVSVDILDQVDTAFETAGDTDPYRYIRGL